MAFKKNGIFIFVFLFTYSLKATAPLNKVITYPDLKVTWDKSLIIKKIGWEGSSSQYSNKKTEILLERKGFLGKSYRLIVLFADPVIAPKIIQVATETNKVHIDRDYVEKVDKEEVWLWGETLESQCRGFSLFSLIFYTNKSLKKSLSGLFAWRLSKEEIPADPILYFLPSIEIDSPKLILSKAFARSQEQWQRSCRSYIGSECHYLYNFHPSQYGRTYQVHFKGLKTLDSSKSQCPI